MENRLMLSHSRIKLIQKINSVETNISSGKLTLLYGEAKKNDGNKNDFSKLVKKYGHIQVNNTFETIWNKDTYIAMIYEGGKLVSCGAIKNPFPEHRRKALSHIDIKSNDTDFRYELGWIVTHPDHRGNGYCCYLVDYLLKRMPNIYATVRITNSSIIQILEAFGFISNKQPFRFHNNGNDVYSFYHKTE